MKPNAALAKDAADDAAERKAAIARYKARLAAQARTAAMEEGAS